MDHIGIDVLEAGTHSGGEPDERPAREPGWDGSPLPAALRARLEREWEHAQFLRTRILELQRERQRAIAHAGDVEREFGEE